MAGCFLAVFLVYSSHGCFFKKLLLLLLLLLGPRHIQPSTYTNVRLLGGECIIPKSTQYVTVVTDITQ